MKTLFSKSKWEMRDAPLEEFLQRVSHDGFDASEIYLPWLAEEAPLCRDLHEQLALGLIGQISTDGVTPDDHLRSLEENYLHALTFNPMKIVAHAGRDIFSFGENVRIFQRGCELAAAHGVPLCFETHRYRALFQLPAAQAYLKAVPDLRITADFAHFTVVHASDLSDQAEGLAGLFHRVGHLHGRVGHSEGPQVPDPRAPEWAEWTARFTGWWKEIHRLAAERGEEVFTITPEFGPPPYMPTIPFENRPVADPWEINVWMLDHLKKNLLIKSSTI